MQGRRIKDPDICTVDKKSGFLEKLAATLLARDEAGVVVATAAAAAAAVVVGLERPVAVAAGSCSVVVGLRRPATG